MKKSVLAIVAVVATSFISSVYAENTASIEIKKSTIGKNETTYISAFVVDDNKAQISTAKLASKANPSYAVTIGNFVNCDTAEGREFCGKMDNGLIGLKEAYVAEVKAKDQEMKVNIDVYVDRKPTTVVLTIGTPNVVLASAKTDESQIAVSAPAPKLESVKAGRAVAGTQYLIIGIILLLSFAFFSARYEKKNVRISRN